MPRFRKMHGLGNDFVIFDARDEKSVLEYRAEDFRRIADRRYGIGCDLVAVMYPSEAQGDDVRVRFFNEDGSESGACGNVTRCIGDIVMRERDSDWCHIGVNDGSLMCKAVGNGFIQVDMGAPKDVQDLSLSYGGVSEPVAVNMGNPHCVFFVEGFDHIDLEEVGAHFEHHKNFPDRTNVEFVQVLDRKHVRQKTWERGVGMTLACGSGACATAVAAVRRGLTERKVKVQLDGGVLVIEHREQDSHVLMAGPIEYVFEGKIDL